MKNIISISFRFSLGVFCVCFYLYKVGQFLCYVVYFWFWRTFYLYFPVYSEFSCQHQCNLLIAYSSPKCPIMCFTQSVRPRTIPFCKVDSIHPQFFSIPYRRT